VTCANHPTAEVSAYCQQCGKPLCGDCARPVGGMIFCEPCLQARLGIPAGGRAPETFPREQASPTLAAVLGFIPGVGAMYNGQFAKALAHVLIFAVFVSLSDRSLIFALLLAAWVFYQVFDAHQTAKARRDGLPLPNPFGLNDLATRMGISQSPATPVPAWTPGSTSGTNPQPGAETGAGQQSGIPASSAYASSPAFETVVTPPAPSPCPRTPVGAIVLIVVGLLLLFQTLGILRALWIGRGWPVLIIGLGVWLLFRRMRETSQGGPR
jgi:hypothetical protein